MNIPLQGAYGTLCEVWSNCRAGASRLIWLEFLEFHQAGFLWNTWEIFSLTIDYLCWVDVLTSFSYGVGHAFLPPTQETRTTIASPHPPHNPTGHPNIIRLCEILGQHEVREVESFRNSHGGAIVIDPGLDIIEDLPCVHGAHWVADWVIWITFLHVKRSGIFCKNAFVCLSSTVLGWGFLMMVVWK